MEIAVKSVVMQLIRHTKGHPQPFVQSSRPDWNNGKERSNDPYEEKLFGLDHTPKVLSRWQNFVFVTELKKERDLQCRK